MFYNLRRKSSLLRDQLFNRIDHRSMVKKLRDVGVERGMKVCVHSALSKVGYFDGGQQMIIDALLEAVGPDGCILMPSFPTTGTMQSWVESGKVFDVRNTPSAVGSLTEVFRTMPGVERSLHPTNPLAGIGPGASELLRDHEKSPTPFGHETPYGRMSARDDTFILMLSTQVLTLIHHLQERVDFPNFFLPGERDTAYLDAAGNRHVLRTKVLRPRIPYYVAIPPVSGEEPDWALIHDFTLIFPRAREAKVKEAGYHYRGYPILLRRRHELAEMGMLKTAGLGRSELGLINVRGFIRKFEQELGELIARYRYYYDDPEAIAKRGLKFL